MLFRASKYKRALLRVPVGEPCPGASLEKEPTFRRGACQPGRQRDPQETPKRDQIRCINRVPGAIGAIRVHRVPGARARAGRTPAGCPRAAVSLPRPRQRASTAVVPAARSAPNFTREAQARRDASRIAALGTRADCAGLSAQGCPPPPLPPRTKWTRRVPHPVLIGHAASLTPVLIGHAAWAPAGAQHTQAALGADAWSVGKRPAASAAASVACARGADRVTDREALVASDLRLRGCFSGAAPSRAAPRGMACLNAGADALQLFQDPRRVALAGQRGCLGAPASALPTEVRQTES